MTLRAEVSRPVPPTFLSFFSFCLETVFRAGDVLVIQGPPNAEGRERGSQSGARLCVWCEKEESLLPTGVREVMWDRATPRRRKDASTTSRKGDGRQMAPLGTQNNSISFPDTEKLSLSGNVSDCEKRLAIQLSIKHSLKIFLVPGFVQGV